MPISRIVARKESYMDPILESICVAGVTFAVGTFVQTTDSNTIRSRTKSGDQWALAFAAANMGNAVATQGGH